MTMNVKSRAYGNTNTNNSSTTRNNSTNIFIIDTTN